MWKYRKGLSRFLSLALLLSCLSQPGMTAYASVPDSGSDDVRGILQEYKDQIASNSDALDKDSGSSGGSTVGAGTGSTEVATVSDAQKPGISLMSLLPLEEKRVYLYLNGYTEDQLKAMPLETVLSLLEDADGNPVKIPADKEVVWTYFKDSEGNVLEEEYHVIGRGDTVDLTGEYESQDSFTMELLVGTGDQLDYDATRYIVTVFISNVADEYLSFELYKETGDGEVSRRQYVSRDGYWHMESGLSEEAGIPVTSVLYIVPEHEAGTDYYLGIDSTLSSERKDIQVDVYPLDQFLKDHAAGNALTGAITDQILDQDNMYQSGGYPGNYEAPKSTAADNAFCLVYSNAETGKLMGYQGLTFTVQNEVPEVVGSLYAFADGQMKNVTEEIPSSYYSSSWEVKFVSEESETGVEVSYNTPFLDFELTEGYEASGTYYFALNEGAQAEKVLVARTKSAAERGEGEDVTAQVLPADRTQVPYGYPMNFSEYSQYYLQVTLSDGVVIGYYVRVEEETSQTATEYDPAPVVGQSDPYFQVNGVNPYESRYIVSNDSSTTIDTYYGYGYQTMFLLDADDSTDLSQLKITFWKPEDVKVHSGSEQVSGESVQDYSEEPVFYQVHIGDALKNYQVTTVKQVSGPKLFVNGPSEREVFLDEYFENKHSILIANIGDKDLTGLKAELIDASHVKLDDYWTLGGEGNDRLAAFTTTNTSGSGEIPSIAKVTLLPDGEGEISGTLKISADGQEDVYIELTGHAGNPKIITEQLDDAVKYVPYSHMVATDNMHDWNKVTFSLTEGELPEGLQLYPATGEIYGVPLETGEFPITVTAEYSRDEFEPSVAEFTLKVLDNTNDNVYNATDEGYLIESHIGTAADGTHDYVLSEPQEQLFVSAGLYGEFIDLWLNGEKLTDGVDYTKESGSTRITIRSQTFENKAVGGSNTIAAEFRVDGDRSKELKRTAQNFRITFKSSSGSSGGSSSSDDSGSSSGSSSSSSGSSGSSSSSTPVQTAEAGFTDNSWNWDGTGWRCLDADGNALADGWHQLPYNGTAEWYYFNEQGYMATGWVTVEGQTYYLNPQADGSQGKMVTGWQYLDDVWYYFNEVSDGTKGAMLKAGWHYLPYEGSVDWYYFDEAGHMLTGWITVDGARYYLNPEADGTRGRMRTGWQQIDGKWYYFYETSDGTQGAMAVNAWIDGHYVDGTGARVD